MCEKLPPSTVWPPGAERTHQGQSTPGGDVRQTAARWSVGTALPLMVVQGPYRLQLGVWRYSAPLGKPQKAIQLQSWGMEVSFQPWGGGWGGAGHERGGVGRHEGWGKDEEGARGGGGQDGRGRSGGAAGVGGGVGDGVA